jgi:hypothetical protein
LRHPTLPSRCRSMTWPALSGRSSPPTSPTPAFAPRQAGAVVPAVQRDRPHLELGQLPPTGRQEHRPRLARAAGDPARGTGRTRRAGDRVTGRVLGGRRVHPRRAASAGGGGVSSREYLGDSAPAGRSAAGLSLVHGRLGDRVEIKALDVAGCRL